MIDIIYLSAMKLADKIRILRKARGLSQEELGFSLSTKFNGVSRQSVSDWENGKSEPKLDNIRALAQFLNVSFDALFNESIDLNDPDVLNKVLTEGYVEQSKKRRYLLFWILFTIFVLGIAISLIVVFSIKANDYLQTANAKGIDTVIGGAIYNRYLTMLIPVLIGSLIIVIGSPLLGIKIFVEAKKYKSKQ